MASLPRPQPWLLVYLLALALLWGNAYLLLVNHPGAYTEAERSYLSLAEGHYDVPAVYRYRVAVPWAAGTLARSLHSLTQFASASGRPPLGLSFFLVNGLLLALAGLYLFRTARAHGTAAGPALIGMAAVMTSGATAAATGFAAADSAAVLAVVVLYYALRVQSKPLLLAVVLLGPVLHESFILFLPLALLYGGFVPGWQRLLAVLGAAGLVLGLHATVDALRPLSTAGNLTGALAAGPDLTRNLRGLLSGRSLVEGGSVFGLFSLVLLAGLWGGRVAIRQWLPLLPTGPALLVLTATLAHGLLTGELSPALLLAAPVVTTALALILDRHPLFAFLRNGPDGGPDQVEPAEKRA